MYQVILFDLDGTLTDPGEGITNSVAYALKKYGISVSDKKELYRFIGPPLHESFEEYYGFSQEKAMEVVACYREYFSETGIYENLVYDGTEEMLKSLKGAGKQVILATSKPEHFANRILDYFHLSDYFDFAAGANMDGTRTKKADVIGYALESCHISDYSQAVMVGDRKHDVLGAAQLGIDAIGVLYGYGSEEELKGAGAVYLAEEPGDILRYVCP
ncbi:MAG: HAD family hydrolase [Lachnospiraceae bacterium]|nr:HAD family hydrolase [Lachnospiraceae bacterium]